jgi:hypothetical protein
MTLTKLNNAEELCTAIENLGDAAVIDKSLKSFWITTGKDSTGVKTIIIHGESVGVSITQ